MQQLAIKHSEQNSKVKTKLIAAVIKNTWKYSQHKIWTARHSHDRHWI